MRRLLWRATHGCAHPLLQARISTSSSDAHAVKLRVFTRGTGSSAAAHDTAANAAKSSAHNNRACTNAANQRQMKTEG